MKLKLISVLFVILLCASASASLWEVHLKSNDVKAIWADTSYVYWGSTGGVVIRDLSSGMEQKIVKEIGGLTSNQVVAIMKEGEGRLWIGTKKRGVCSLDEGGWKNYSTNTLELPSDQVTHIAGYGDLVCVATTGGVSLFEGGEFRKFFVGDDWSGSECSQVNCALISGQRMIVGTDCGVFEYRFDLDMWKDVITGKAIIDGDFDGKSLFWLITSDSIYTYDGADVQVIPKTFIKHDDIVGIAASDTIVWVATSNGPSKYDFANSYWVRNRNGLEDYLRNSSPIFISSIFISSNGTPWLATKLGAAELVDSTWTLLQSAGPAGNYVEDIAIDWQDRLWCATGTRGGGAGDVMRGVLRYDGSNWEQIGPPTIRDNNVYCVEVSPVDGSVWLGIWSVGNGDLIRYDPSNDEWYSYQDALASRVVSDIYIDNDGHVIFGEYLHGLAVMCDDGNIIRYVKGEEPECIRTECVTAIGPGRDGSIMVGDFRLCEGEVYNLELGADCLSKGDDVCRHWSAGDGFVGGSVNDIELDPYGIVWLATGGLSAYDGSWHAIDTPMGLVWDIEVDKWGTKWVASDVGLWALHGFGTRWDDFANSYELYDSYNSPLPDAPIKALAFDADGDLWIGTGGGGIYRFTPPKPVIRTRSWVDAYPNPFEFVCPHEGRIHEADCIAFTGYKPGTEISIYTLTGELVVKLEAGECWSRDQMIEQDITSGIYIYHAFAQDGSEFVGRIAIIR